MKVIGFIGSPRGGGSTTALVAEALKGAAAAGAETQIVFLQDLHYGGCLGCYQCRTTGCCAQLDDLVPALYDLAASDAVILASPNYMGGITGQLKLMIDRFCVFMNPDFSSRLAEGKKLGLIFTQGQPNAAEYADYYASLARSLTFLGFTGGQETLVAAGLRGPGDADAALLAKAYALGTRLATPESVETI